jgi:hypothetical protein
VQEQNRPLLNFLRAAAWDHDLHQRFMEADSIEEFLGDDDVKARLDSYGWARLGTFQRLFTEPERLRDVQGALIAEALGEEYSLDDVGAHQGPHFGPCWVLVRI